MCARVSMGTCVCAHSNLHMDVPGERGEEGEMAHGNWGYQAFYQWDTSLFSLPRHAHPLSDSSVSPGLLQSC